MYFLLREWLKRTGRKQSTKWNRGNSLTRRMRFLERLEPRVVLNAAAVALDDPWYYTAEDTTLVIGTSDTTLLDNDWDPEGSALTASVVAGPAHGTLISFDDDGTFEYEPDTSFVGWDTFTYKVSDGTSDSAIVTATIAVGGHFGPRTNLEERTRDARWPRCRSCRRPVPRTNLEERTRDARLLTG